MSLEERARAFATERHSDIGQLRKYTDEPYINHPAAVVELVKTVWHTDSMLAAAWLHDVVEDTKTSIEEIEDEFGMVVANYVEMLTDISVQSDGNRATRKAIDREHTARAHPNAKTIKLADLIDNSRSIIDRDPKFAKVYLEEKRLLLEVLKEGDQTLWNQANEIVRNAS